MEFVQYHPTGLPFTGILITEAARAEGGYLINKDGYRYLQDYNLGKPQPEPVLRTMELGPRDRLSQAFMKELREGTHDRDAVRPRRAPRSAPPRREEDQREDPVRARAVPEVPEPRSRQGADSRCRPVVHYMMGGVHTDINGATPLPGLYAAGEVACVSINGANRLGSNSLPELLVFGARAGKAAAEYASLGLDINPRVLAQANDEQRRLERDLLHRKGRERLADTPRRDAEDDGGERRHLPRRPQSLDARASTSCASCRSAIADLAIEDHSRTFNTERIAALELAFMLDVAETIVTVGAARARSRAARISAPISRSATTSASSRIRWCTATPTARARVEYLPVTITRWPPAERVYGEAAPHGGPHHVAGRPLSSGAGV